MPSNQEDSQQAAVNTNTSANEAQTKAAQPAATKQKTEAGKILAGIAHVVEAPVIFAGKELSAFAKLFANTEPQIQDALNNASQLVQTIKTEVNENPVVVAYLLRKIDPNYTDDMLNGMLTKVASALNITTTIVQPTLTDTIAALQAHAAQLTPGTVEHSNFFTSAFNILGTLIAPGTPWSKIVTLGVYIYGNDIQVGTRVKI